MKAAYFLCSTVYFVECDAPSGLLVKVGKADDPHARASTLQTGCPYPIARLRYVNIPGGGSRALRIEKDILGYLSSWRTVGEWHHFPLGDERGGDFYQFGVPGQLNCHLGAGAWEFITVDWQRYAADQVAKKVRFLAKTTPALRRRLRGQPLY